MHTTGQGVRRWAGVLGRCRSRSSTPPTHTYPSPSQIPVHPNPHPPAHTPTAHTPTAACTPARTRPHHIATTASVAAAAAPIPPQQCPCHNQRRHLYRYPYHCPGHQPATTCLASLRSPAQPPPHPKPNAIAGRPFALHAGAPDLVPGWVEVVEAVMVGVMAAAHLRRLRRLVEAGYPLTARCFTTAIPNESTPAPSLPPLPAPPLPSVRAHNWARNRAHGKLGATYRVRFSAI